MQERRRIPPLLFVLCAFAALRPAYAEPTPLDPDPKIYEIRALDAEFGVVVCGAGDVDGDGFPELLIGAPSWSSGTQKTGRVFLYPGSENGALLEPSWSRLGESSGADLGRAMAGAGDVNDDGYDDVLLAEPKFSGDYSFEGRVLLILGSSTGLADSFAWEWRGAQDDARIGSALVGLGDVNGDGFDDVAISGHLYDPPEPSSPQRLSKRAVMVDAGRVWIFHGNASGLETTPTQLLDGEHASAYFGRSLCSAGDVDGDGPGDLLVGAIGQLRDADARGAALLFRGPTFNGAAWWRAHGRDLNDFFGWSLAAGEIDDTPGRDLLIGAWGVDGHTSQDEGEAYLFVDAAAGGVVSSPNAAAGAAWTGSNGEFRASYGISVDVLGDLDGDGHDEFAVGSFRADDDVQIDEGEAYLYRGGPVGAIVSPVWIGRGGETDAFFGRSVANVGDLDQDGLNELAVGAPGPSTAARAPGRVFVYLGGEPPVTNAPVIQNGIPLHMPSPCRAGSRLSYRLRQPGPLTLEIYDLRGRRVRVLLEESRSVGEHELVFDGRDARGRLLPSGSYLLRLRAGTDTRVAKFVFLP